MSETKIDPRRTIGAARLLAVVILAAMVAVLFATSPRHEDFWWPDAASFALNGAFIRDYIANGLPHAPIGFATAWFLRYPALTISLYPPVFPVAEAAVFSVFGVSHPAAQATVAAFAALAAYGAYRVARTGLPALSATGFALVLFGTPGVLLWSRQVMMETPSLSFLLLGAFALLRYQAVGRAWHLILASLMVLTATYTKQPAIYVAPGFAVALLVIEGARVLRRRAVWLALVVGVVGLLPLVAFTLAFAPRLVDEATRQGVASLSDGPSRTFIKAATVYARALPEIVGWPPLAGALVYAPLVAIRGWRDVAEKRIAVLMLAWFVSEYVVVSTVGHFEARYGMLLAVPAAMFLVLLIARLVRERWSPMVTLAVGGAWFAASLAMHPVRSVDGYGAVAATILEHSRQNDVVLLDLYYTQNVTFSLRARSTDPKIYALRAEKLLTNYSVGRERGITDRNLSTDDIEKMIDRDGITLVALQPNFWTDQPSMARLQALVYSSRFERLDEIPITDQDGRRLTTIELFRNTRSTIPAEDTIRQLQAP